MRVRSAVLTVAVVVGLRGAVLRRAGRRAGRDGAALDGLDIAQGPHRHSEAPPLAVLALLVLVLLMLRSVLMQQPGEPT